VRISDGRRRIRHVTRSRGLFLALFFGSCAAAASADPHEETRPPAPAKFQLFPAPPSMSTVLPLSGLDGAKQESLLRLPGDSDSVFTLGGPGPSGEPRVRLAVEVNEVVLKILAPDPKLDANDLRGRSGGDWKPIDATGRPYQLRFGARVIW